MATILDLGVSISEMDDDRRLEFIKAMRLSRRTSKTVRKKTSQVAKKLANINIKAVIAAMPADMRADMIRQLEEMK